MPNPSIRIHTLLLSAGLLLAFNVNAYTVYVSSEKDNRITAVDGESLTTLGEAKVGQRPRGIVLSPDNKVLYVCASDDDRIDVVDLETLKVTHTLPSGPDPELLVLSADGRYIYVANEDDNMVTVVDVEQRSKLTEIQVGVEPEGMGLSPDGKWLVNTSVAVIDTASMKVEKYLLAGGGSGIWPSLPTASGCSPPMALATICP